MEGKIDIDDPLAQMLRLDRINAINAGFDLTKKGESVRPLVLYP